MVICSNCGGKIDGKLSACPYCGYIYELGAQRQYMEKLEDIREDMGQLLEESKEIYEKEVRYTLRRLLGIFLVLAGVFGILLIGWAGLHIVVNQSGNEEEIKDSIVWQNEYFPILDRWYAEGNYDAILQFNLEQADQDNDGFYRWEHSIFISRYEEYVRCMEIQNRLNLGEELTASDTGDGLVCALRLLFFLDTSLYTEDELEVLMEYQDQVEAFLYGDFGFTREEIGELLKEADKGGYLDYDVCYEYGKKAADRYR